MQYEFFGQGDIGNWTIRKNRQTLEKTLESGIDVDQGKIQLLEKLSKRTNVAPEKFDQI